MIRSMTAFGRHTEAVNNKNITVEIKSVNNRYFDCSVRISRSYSFLEEKIKPHLQSQGISRGKVDVSITIEPIGGSDVMISLNEDYAKAYYNALVQLKETLDLPGEITVATLQRDSNIFTLSKVEEDEEQDWADLCSVLNVAIERFIVEIGRAHV